MMPPTRETLLDLYRAMAHIRACDEVIRNALISGRIMFFYFPITGHEAIAAAMSQALRKDDHLVVTYRGVHHQLAKGVPFAGILGEMTGKSTAMSDGKCGTMHVCMPEIGMMLSSGIVGGTLPPAAGMALASKIRKDGRVTMCFFGDGAINTGSFHEAMNFAAVYELPVVFVCENNRYAETTPTHHTYKGTITGRADAYAIPAETVDGYDPIAVHRAMSAAVARARDGGGPSLIEATCFRYYGHYFGDPMITVPKDELAAEMAKDPFKSFTGQLVESGTFSAEELQRIKADADAEAQAVLAANLAAPPVSRDGMLERTYANPISVN
jgi:acetoin:2,6-dichlorophenolindophenol oxidoreductase subunit alpha